MTGTPRWTASLIAPVTSPASETEISTALAPSLTAWAMRCACTCPSSEGGVSHTTSIGTLCLAESSLAAASAPVRADRKTGLVDDLAIMAILSPRLAGAPGSDLPHATRGRVQSAVTKRRRVSELDMYRISGLGGCSWLGPI